VDEDFATLINGEEKILIKLTQISNILKGYVNEEDTNTNSTNASSQSNSENDNNTKAESDATSKVATNKSENKSVSTSKEDSSNSAKSSSSKEKSNKQQEVTAKIDEIEPNTTMVWSQPIKIESTLVQTKDELSTNIIRTKKSQVTEKDAAKSSNDMEKSIVEAMSSKSKGNDQSKEMKPVKESATIETTDNNPAPPFKIQLNDGKPIKTQETVKSAASPNQASKNTETVKTAETTTVWKQKEPETKVYRFAGEPGDSDSQKAFPFAGWPNRNNRVTRF
jgi:hypothetical protein